MFKNRRSLLCQRGLSLVEIMIAMALSLILLGGVIQIFVSSKQSYLLADNLSRMQENARFAMEMLTRDVRMAGYMSCQQTGNVANTLNSTSYYNDFFNNAVRGYEGGQSTFPADLSAAVAGTDAIVILKGGNATFAVESHQPQAAQFKLSGSHDVKNNEILLVCDPKQAAVFQVTNANAANVTIVHNTGGSASPGNCSKLLGSTGSSTCSAGSFVAYSFAQGSQIVRFEGVAYYIGASVSGSTRSLYRKQLKMVGTTQQFNAEELVEDVENMQVLYGVDVDGDRQSDRYLLAHQIAAPLTWNDVVTVRIGLLLRTPDNVAAQPDTASYNVASTIIPANGSDRRQRYVVTSTVKIRNRGLD